MSQFIFALAVLTFSIFVHEMGHFLMARWRGLTVPRFSIFGLGKPIISRKWRGVEWCICWIPIGAYVMIPQLSDLGEFEGELPADTPKLPTADYVSKVLVAVAGPAANILLALALGCVVWIAGFRMPVEYNRAEIGEVMKEIKTLEGKTVPGPAAAAGLQFGDKILKIDDKPVKDYEEVMIAIVFGSQVAPDGRRVAQFTIERDGATLTKQVYPELIGPEGLRAIGIGPRTDLIVEKVVPDSPAAKAGLQPRDQILAVDGTPLSRSGDLREHFQKKNETPSILQIKRAGALQTVSLQPRLDVVDGKSTYLIGVQWKIEWVEVHPNPFEQIANTIRQSYQTLFSLINRKSDIGVRHMSGMVGMVDNLQQAANAGIVPAFAFLLVINVSLAVFNLLPIPVLDGGHILFATLTKIRRRAPNPAVMQGAVTACFFLLISLIVYVTYHDIIRAIQNRADDAPAAAAPAKPGEAKKKSPDKPADPTTPPVVVPLK